jgi:hypothetical protein
MGDENVDLVKSVYEKLKDVNAELSVGCDENNLTAANKRLFNSVELSGHHALQQFNKTLAVTNIPHMDKPSE